MILFGIQVDIVFEFVFALHEFFIGRPRAPFKWDRILKTIQIENYSIIGDRLDEGDELKEGQILTNNDFYAIMQFDGNFALYSSSDCNENNLLWISKTSNVFLKRPFI